MNTSRRDYNLICMFAFWVCVLLCFFTGFAATLVDPGKAQNSLVYVSVFSGVTGLIGVIFTSLGRWG